MKVPEPLIVSWQGRELRVRHDDPHLGPYTPHGAVIRSAIELASDVDGLRLVLASTVGDRYRTKLSDDGCVVGCGASEDAVTAQDGPGRPGALLMPGHRIRHSVPVLLPPDVAQP